MRFASLRRPDRHPCIAWVHAHGWDWLDGREPDERATVIVVLDVVGETVVNIAMPASIWGADRRAYLASQIEFALPNVPLRAVWPSAGVIWPKAEDLVVFGVEDPSIQPWIEEALQRQRAIAGVWTLTQALYAHMRKAQPTQLAVLVTPHGLRLLWQTEGKARFTRSIVGVDRAVWQRELEATIRYLRDQRLASRDEPVAVQWYGPAHDTPQLDERSALLTVLPVPKGHDDWCHALLRRATRALPAQLAPTGWRRFALARRVRQALAAVSVLTVAAFAYDASLTLVAGVDAQQTLTLTQREVQQLQQQLQEAQAQVAQTGIAQAVVRAALTETEAARLPAELQLPVLAQTVARWLQAAPGMVVRQLAWRVTTAPCADTGSAAASSFAGAESPPGADAAPQYELRWSVSAAVEYSRAQQERLLRALDQVQRNDPRWSVQRETLGEREHASLRLGRAQDSASSRADDGLAEWCLTPRAADAAPTTADAPS